MPLRVQLAHHDATPTRARGCRARARRTGRARALVRARVEAPPARRRGLVGHVPRRRGAAGQHRAGKFGSSARCSDTSPTSSTWMTSSKKAPRISVSRHAAHPARRVRLQHSRAGRYGPGPAMAPQNFTAVLPGGTRMTFDATLPDGRPPIGQMSECEVVCRGASALRDQGWRLTSLRCTRPALGAQRSTWRHSSSSPASVMYRAARTGSFWWPCIDAGGSLRRWKARASGTGTSPRSRPISTGHWVRRSNASDVTRNRLRRQRVASSSASIRTIVAGWLRCRRTCGSGSSSG